MMDKCLWNFLVSLPIVESSVQNFAVFPEEDVRSGHLPSFALWSDEALGEQNILNFGKVLLGMIMPFELYLLR